LGNDGKCLCLQGRAAAFSAGLELVQLRAGCCSFDPHGNSSLVALQLSWTGGETLPSGSGPQGTESTHSPRREGESE